VRVLNWFCRLVRVVGAISCVIVSASAPVARSQTNPAPQYLFAYVGGGTPTIVTYTVDATSGALNLIAAPPASPKSNAVSMCVNSAATLLFTATSNSAGQAAVGVFLLGSDGSLTELTASPFSGSAAGATPITCATSRDGKFLYLLSWLQVSQQVSTPSAIVDVFSIGPDGTVAIVNTYTIAGMVPSTMLVHVTGSWLYVWGNAGMGDHSSSIEQFTVGPSGTLTDNGPFTLQPFATPPLALVGDNRGTFLFGSYEQFGGGSAGLIDSFSVNSVNGSLAIASNFNNTSGNTAPNLAVASTNNYLYSNAFSYSITNGVLASLDTLISPSPGAEIPPSLIASPNSPLLFEAGQGQNAFFLSSQMIGTDGSLTSAPGSPYTPPNGLGIFTIASTGIAPIPTEPILRPNVASATITNVVVGQTGNSTIGITNWGYSQLTVSNVSVSGDPSFSQTNTCTSPLAPMATCQVTINFVPTSAGMFDGILTLEGNAPTETVTISATSRNPSPDPQILPSQQLLLPDTALGASNTLPVTLENFPDGTAPLIVSGITFAGSNPGDFSETNNCTSSIPVGSSCLINLTFTPQALGNRAALLNIATNAPDGSISQATLSGNSVTAVTKFSFTTVANGPGTVTQSPAGTSLANNTTITVKATPNANSSFVSWNGVCVDIGNFPTCTFVLNANTIATGNFVPNVTFATSVVGPGTITQSPTGTSFASGSQVILTAVPNAGAQFLSWTSSSPCASGTPATECVITLNANTTVTATFSGPQVSLATNVVGPGTIQQTPPGASFASGTSIALTAVPNANAQFTGWSGACSGSANPVCTFAINANTSVTATFANIFTLATNVSGPGTIQQTPSGTSFASGASITLTAVPSANATFTSWVGACAGSTNSICTFVLTANTSVTATFTANPAVTVPQTPPPAPAGSTITAQINVTGFAMPPTLTASCTIPQGSCSISGTTLTVTTTARSSGLIPAKFRRAPNLPPAPREILIIALAMLGLALLTKNSRVKQFLRPTALVGALLVAGCGGGSSMPPVTGTPAGNYTVTIKATLGAQTASTSVSITVQ